MSFLDSVDWGSLVAFFGEHGKLIATAIAFIVGLISLMVAYLKYRHGKIEDGVRRQLERLLKQKQVNLEITLAEVEIKQKALEQAANELRRQRDDISKREVVINSIRAAFKGKEGELWCMHTARPPNTYSRLGARGRKPIILVANLKGGVGKTTLTANLAAFFNERGKRVLLLDCDYQGSLSNMVQSADRVTEVPAGMIDLLSPGADSSTFARVRRPFSNVLRRASIVPARYELASLENRILIEYLLQESQDDGRYRLANALLSDEAIDSFDVALIDAPPRLTAAAINGFCASTHLLIPTLYDGLSSEAVGTFIDGFRTLKRSLNHEINPLGVVGMLTYRTEDLGREQDAKEKTRRQILETWQLDIPFFDRHIPRKASIAKAAGESIAYYDDPVVRDLFDQLGDEISRRLGFGTHEPRRSVGRTQLRVEPQILQEAEATS